MSVSVNVISKRGWKGDVDKGGGLKGLWVAG